MSIKTILNDFKDILTRPEILSDYPNISEEDIELIEKAISSSESSKTYKKIYKIETVSSGLVLTSNSIKLANNWGVVLSKFIQPHLVDNPKNIRVKRDNILIANQGINSNVGCVVVDSSYNFKASVGIKTDTPILSNGQYSSVDDFNINYATNKYYVVSSNDNIVHFYDVKTTKYLGSIGNGTFGVPSTSSNVLSNPVGIDFGINKIYILCKSGIPTGATGHGYLAVYTLNGDFVSIPIYHGKNNGTGKCFQGEISEPKSIFVYTKGEKDLVYILNSSDDIGVFDSSDNYNLLDVYHIPSQIAQGNLGLSKITRDEKYLYVTASNIGKVIVIDINTKELVTSFGTLADESTKEATSTLSKFNGLSGIAVLNDRIIVSETINNRIQAFGHSLLKNELFIIYSPESILDNEKVKNIVYEINAPILGKISILVGNDEYDIDTIKNFNFNYFRIKIKIDPTIFSLNKREIPIIPFYVLIE